jgi:hypothetical protein
LITKPAASAASRAPVTGGPWLFGPSPETALRESAKSLGVLLRHAGEGGVEGDVLRVGFVAVELEEFLKRGVGLEDRNARRGVPGDEGRFAFAHSRGQCPREGVMPGADFFDRLGLYGALPRDSSHIAGLQRPHEFRHQFEGPTPAEIEVNAHRGLTVSLSAQCRMREARSQAGVK